MNNNLIIVDAGHGGIDSGAVGNGLQEKNLNLEAARYIFNRLKELSIPAILVRETDEYLPKTDRINRINKIVNDNPNKNILLISNHINAGGAEGAEVVYSLKNNSTLADLILDNIGNSGQIKRKTYQRRLPENPNKDYYYILRESGNVEPVLIEYGFIDNRQDANKLNNYLDNYAEGVVKAITEYLGYNYFFPDQNNESKAQDYYIVKKGDTLYSISKKFNISIDNLKQINNIVGNNISEGQKLYLTNIEQNNDNNTYIVKKGDTLYSIAKQFNLKIEDIIKENKLNGNILDIGQLLLIPNKSNSENEELLVEEYDVYIVKKGDSLWKIARENNIPVPELIDLNNLNDLTLQINQKLLIPKKNKDNNTYIVKKGDTLWSIAKKLNIDVNELKKLNNLESNLLSIGQELII